VKETTFNGPESLNEFQRRGLSATFRTLEEMLQEIETLINSDGYKGSLLEIDNDSSPEAREKIAEKIQFIREKVSRLSKQFSLEMKQTKSSSRILADLAYCWEILEGSKAKKLRGYGEVAEGLEEVLDPQIDTIIGIITEMENLMKKGGE
jgi:hypothetical protein